MTTDVIKNGTGIKVTSKRPIRDTIICQDDITNLKIALETSKTLEEFLARV